MDRAGYLAVGGTDLGSNTDWTKQVTQSGVTVVNNLGLSGGTGNTVYRFSVNVRDVQGILKNSGFDQINGRFSLQQTAFNGKVRFSLDASSTTRNTNYSFQEALRYAVTYNPTAPILASGGANSVTGGPYYEASLFDNFNPVGILNQNINDGKKTTINVSGKLDVDILPGLTGTATYAIQRENELTGQYYSKYAYFRGFNRTGLAQRNTNQGSKDILEMYLSYNKQMNDLNLAVTAGYSYQERQNQGYGVSTGNFLTDALGYNALSSSQDLAKGGLTTLSSYASPDQKLIGFFGRANANYKETYLLSASVRHEGYSGFGLGNKWGTFGAVSGAVVLNKLFDIPSVSNLKLRAGYGLTGALPPTYGLSQTQYGQSASYGYSGGGLIPVVNTTLAPNANLKWEQKAEVNVGLDFGFMNNRLTGSLDVYQRNATNFILSRPIDASQNVASTQYQNLGEIKSNGIELALSYAAIQKADFTWTTTLVASHVKSVLVKLYSGTETATGLPETGSSLGAPGQNSTYTIQNIAGQQVGTMWGPTYQGVDASGNPILSATPGIIGHGLPTLDLGWTNTFTYKNFDLNFFFRGTFGHQIINSYRAFYEPVVGGQISSYNRVNTKYFDPNLKNAQWSSYYVENGDFVKLDNLQLGYNFRFAQGSMISKMRVYAGGNNLIVITGYTGTDPEARLTDSGGTDNGAFNPTVANPLAPGIDRRNNYFRARTVTLGVSLSF
jgi:iron complex outermembrane receptor protein